MKVHPPKHGSIGLIHPRINQARHPGRENLFMNGNPIFKDNIRAFCKVDVHPKPTNDTNVSLLKEQSRLEDFSGSPWQETPIEKIILGGFFGQITAPRFLPADDLPPSFHFTQAFRGHHVTRGSDHIHIARESQAVVQRGSILPGSDESGTF